MGKMKFGKSSQKSEKVQFEEISKQVMETHKTVFEKLAQFEKLEQKPAPPLATMREVPVKEIHYKPINKPDTKARTHSRLLAKKLKALEAKLNQEPQIIIPAPVAPMSNYIENKYDDSKLKALINELRSEVYDLNQFEKNAPSVVQPPQEKQPQSKLIYVAIGLTILNLIITFIK